MSLPARLYPGYISIYGAKSVNSITTNSKGLQFGVINQLYDNLPQTVSLNQSVMFKEEDTIRVSYNNTDYFIIQEQKIILIEEILS